MVKERKERDCWQLTRDLTVEEFEECKKIECEFVKKVVNRDSFTGHFAKILKISNKWKIIVYFKDKKSTETSRESGERENGQTVRDTGSISQNERDFGESYLDAPPQRIYSELSGISMYQNPKKPNNDKVGSSSKGVALMENQVVDEIDKYNRKGVEDDATIYTVTSKKLQKDNVTTDEVVKIINDHGEN
ncbi:hypothetical protein GLOIN_2v1761429 [Rhizophagus irregularis DAOM 181602=DAOM 197198]|uniref:Uncharacterized protein n=1 Tax=Rhizophagus irregularis (strain DAOM 197198w) TaxID=1432141 RepID=A0A015LMZ3_RHIIW|nr:hypothetical protein RirG_219100 [Rhizophagus irregularis DAOM 197198w]GET60666.1 hypothetical protein GLOIN_2v1761429 [Rhizophagus irregularis DAOM 181602=DAOM 197198]